MQYVHAPLGEEVEFIAGSYHIEEESRLPYDEHEVLYLVGQTSSITSCCGGVSPFSFIKVVGYVKNWQRGRDASGLPVSDVEVVRSEDIQNSIREVLHQKHRDIEKPRIEFW